MIWWTILLSPFILIGATKQFEKEYGSLKKECEELGGTLFKSGEDKIKYVCVYNSEKGYE